MGRVHAAVEALGTAVVERCTAPELDALAGMAQQLRGFAASADARIARRREELWSTPIRPVDAAGAGEPDQAGSTDPNPAPPAGGSDPPPAIAPELLEQAGANKDRRSDSEANRDHSRARALVLLPAFEAALRAGQIDTAHIDALVALYTRLREEPHALETIVAREADLLNHARQHRPEHFRRRCTDLARELESAHGLRQAERLRARSSIRRWTDREGLRHLHVSLDPERAAIIDAAIDEHTDRIRSRDPNATMPFDQLQLTAFCELLGQAPVLDQRRPELIVIVDAATLATGTFNAGSVCETATGGEIAPQSVRRLACDADLVPVVLGGDSVPIDVGRARRLATRSQRQALLAMHRTCAHPECGVRVEHCRIHHVKPWEHGGSTDLDNLVPLCSRHHHQVHEGGWSLRMTADRHCTWKTPGGDVWFTGDTRDRSPDAPADPGLDPPPDRSCSPPRRQSPDPPGCREDHGQSATT